MSRYKTDDPQMLGNVKSPQCCSFCGDRMFTGSYWHGHGVEIFCCSHCAVYSNPLAALLADAVMDKGPYNPNLDPQAKLDLFEGQYWRAVALAALRKGA